MNIKVIGLEALQDGLLYLVSNPKFLLRAALNTARMRLGIPLDSLRWLIAHFAHGPKVPKDIELRAAAPALGVDATLNMMGTPLRVSADLHFDDLRQNGEQVVAGLRVRKLAVKAPEGSPAQQMLGALDLSKPGNLMMFMPKRPPALVESKDDLFVFDLLKVGKFAQNESMRRAVQALLEVVSIRSIEVDGDLLVVALRPQPLGLPSALARLRA